MDKIADVRSNLLPNVKKTYNFFVYASFILSVVSLILYISNGRTQYNAQSLAPIVIVMISIAIFTHIVSVLFDIRYVKYLSSLALLMAFLQFFIREINFFSNWVIAIDPVTGDIIAHYLSVLILLFVAAALSFVSAIMNKKAYYREEKDKEADDEKSSQ